jgi:hypothetical protein
LDLKSTQITFCFMFLDILNPYMVKKATPAVMASVCNMTRPFQTLFEFFRPTKLEPN